MAVGKEACHLLYMKGLRLTHFYNMYTENVSVTVYILEYMKHGFNFDSTLNLPCRTT